MKYLTKYNESKRYNKEREKLEDYITLAIDSIEIDEYYLAEGKRDNYELYIYYNQEMDPLVVLSNLDKLVKFLNTKYKYTYFQDGVLIIDITNKGIEYENNVLDNINNTLNHIFDNMEKTTVNNITYYLDYSSNTVYMKYVEYNNFIILNEIIFSKISKYFIQSDISDEFSEFMRKILKSRINLDVQNMSLERIIWE